MYDSLGRLVRAKNPEQGVNANLSTSADPVSGNTQWALSYGYDNNGNLQTRTDARNVTTTYGYDNLNRLKQTNYSDATPYTLRTYDFAANGRGRFYASYESSPTGTLNYVTAYDGMGRPTAGKTDFYQAGTGWTSYPTSREYDLLGHVTTQTYPSGHTVNYTQFDAAGRLKHFTGNLGDGALRTYATGIAYDAASRLSREQFGTQVPLYHKHRYNVRGQLWDVRLSTVNDADNWNRGMVVNSYGSGDFVAWGTSGTDNNGNVLRSHHYVPGDDNISTFTVNYEDYTYDALNRLTSMSERRQTQTGADTAQFTQGYTYDRWGNRQINQAGTTPTLAPEMRKAFQVDAATNRLGVPAGQAGVMGYDAAGNLTEDSYTGAGTRLYDAENRMTSAAVGLNSASSYTYDADGKRVRRQTPNETVWQVYGLEGELLAEYAANAPAALPQREYGYRNGELLVTADTTMSKLPVTTATASSAYGANAPTQAIDGNEATAWIASGGPTQWIELDLGAATSVRKLRLKVNQSPDGATTHQLSGGTTPGALSPLATLTGTTQHGAWVEATFAPTSVRYVRIKTTSSPSWVAWSEVEVYGAAPPATLAAGNSGFESPSCGTGFQYTPAGATWTFTGGAGIAGNSSAFTSGNPAAPQGSQVGFVQMTGTASESVSGFQANQSYTVKFRAAQRGNSQGNNQDFEVFIDNTSLGVFRPQGTSYAEMGTAVFTTSAGTHTLKFVGKNTNGGDNTAFIDEVRVESAVAEVNWLVTDHLGTPRMVVDQTGTLAGVKRHDYLPFGEELTTQGGRNAQQGYQSNNSRQGFTSYKHDMETNLEFAQARYFASAQGRFTSPDPLQSSATSLNPQTWNRYSYVMNNPLAYVDPTGMFAWSKNLGGNKSDELLQFEAQVARNNGDYSTYYENMEILITRQTITDAMNNALKAAESSNLTSQESRRIKDAIAAYGLPGVDNGVTVGLDKDPTEGGYTHVEGKQVIVAFNPMEINAANVAHEGVHAQQALTFVKTGRNTTTFDTENAAYTVGALTNVGLSNIDKGSVLSYGAVGNNGIQTTIWGANNFLNGNTLEDAKAMISTNVATHLANNGIGSNTKVGVKLAFPGDKGHWR